MKLPAAGKGACDTPSYGESPYERKLTCQIRSLTPREKGGKNSFYDSWMLSPGFFHKSQKASEIQQHFKWESCVNNCHP